MEEMNMYIFYTVYISYGHIYIYSMNQCGKPTQGRDSSNE